MSSNNNLWEHLSKVGILPCDDGDHDVEIDDPVHPSWIARSFHFDCLQLDNTVFHDVYATLSIEGTTEVTFASFDFTVRVDIDQVILLIDQFEGALRERLRSFLENRGELI